MQTKVWWRNIPDPKVPQKKIIECKCGGKYIKTDPKQKMCVWCKEGKVHPRSATIDPKYDDYMPFMGDE